jgi:predicted ATPase/DNA-binding winged helix-turn-helix (wHTH) protein
MLVPASAIMSDPSAHHFERLVVLPAQRRLLFNGAPAKIGARAFDVLLALIERRHRVVSKDELLELTWPDVRVEDGNLQVQIFALRKLLGPQAIATVPGRGYRFAMQEASSTPRQQRAGAERNNAAQGNLPARLPPLFGRDFETDDLLAQIALHRLVSVVGPPGIGKTLLTQFVVREWQDRERGEVWWVELASLEAPELVVATVSRVLGRTLGAAETAPAALAEALRPRELLLALDNCEHLAPSVAQLARALLDAAPGVRLVLTSQKPLHLPEEHVFRLGPLAIPPDSALPTAMNFGAVALFVARAQAAEPRFALDEDNVAAVVEICARLDGVALAIELAAARVRLLGVFGVRRRLEERFQLLASGSEGSLPRHRALRAAFEWSYGLLSDDERHVLDRLGIFVGGFSLVTAEFLVAEDGVDSWAALDHISTLVDKSLVSVDPGEPPRYRLLESTRAFALERLSTTAALGSTQRRHAMALIHSARSLGFQTSPLERTVSFSPELDNLRAAMAWALGPDGDRQIAIELTAETNFIWYVLGFNDEGAAIFRAVEPWVDETTPPAIKARLWLSRCKLYSAAARTAADLGLAAADIFRSLGDRESLFDTLTTVAIQFGYVGNVEGADRALREADSLSRADWPKWTGVVFLFAHSSARYWAGALDEARIGISKALDLNRGENEDPAYTEQLEMMLVACDVGSGRSEDALRGSRALLEQRTPPIRGAIRAFAESYLSASLAQLGMLDEADSVLRAALPRITRAVGTARTALCHFAFIRALQGRVETAARLLGAVDCKIATNFDPSRD